MTSPYEILGLTPQASEDEIRNRYLQLVREFPPDRAPQRFAEIRAAYDELRDPLVRLEKQIFSPVTQDSLSLLAADLRTRLKTSRLPVAALLSLAENR
ncbi:J domain-containing protein [Anatilimnocola sp. NA78]|uniref:J domain-containing protein n=1 Tax=Anatilimnocola sp. NA78 TaxID=3415683 RepID=UPI003CE4A1BE